MDAQDIACVCHAANRELQEIQDDPGISVAPNALFGAIVRALQ
jgi:hypothetical protein